MITALRQTEEITTPAGTAYSVYLTQPRVVTHTAEDGTVIEHAYYEVTQAFDEGTDLSEVERLVRKVAAAAFGADAETALRGQGQLSIAQSKDDIASAFGPFRTAGPNSKYFPAGTRRIWLRASPFADGPPTVIGTAPDKRGLPAVLAPADIYSGMKIKVRVSAHAFGYEAPDVFSFAGGTLCVRGVALYLGDTVQKVADGPRLSAE